MAAEKPILFNIVPAAPRSRCSRTGVSVGYAQVCCEVGLRKYNTPESLVATARDPLNVPMQSARFDGAITRYLSQTT